MIQAAEEHGYCVAEEENQWLFDFRSGKLDYPLPDGFHFIVTREADSLKEAVICTASHSLSFASHT